jgi:hypothetical protein
MKGRCAPLKPRVAEHIVKLCGMIGSAHDGEALTAARMAEAHVRQFGLTGSDVIRVPEHWRVMARACVEQLDLFDEAEQRFVHSMARYRYLPTDKQLAWLETIFDGIAVTPEQFSNLALPTRPTKTTDSQGIGLGDSSVELDAIEPRRLRGLVEDVIRRHLPDDQLAVLLAAEDSERELLTAFAARFPQKAAS